MKFELNNFLINICGWIIIISMGFFLVVFVIFLEDKIQQPFKETLTLTLSFLSALATIGAAIIAARIFQTWKNQHSYIEQSKLLGQMVQTLDNLRSALVDVRQNDNLKNIFLRYRSNLPMNEAFTNQMNRAEKLDTYIVELRSLENQIYLLNNVKGVSRVFSKEEQAETSFDNLTNLLSNIKADISYIHRQLSINYGKGSFVIANLDLKEPLVREAILNILFEGDKLLRQAEPDEFILDHNPVNFEISKCIDELNQSILKYKDSLELLS